MPKPILFELGRLKGPNITRTGAGGASPRGVGPQLRGVLTPKPLPTLLVSGVTRDSTGAAIGSCVVELYRRNQDQTRGDFVATTTSDGSGNFSFVVGAGQQYQYVAYKTGSPDVAGVSLRTEAGV